MPQKEQNRLVKKEVREKEVYIHELRYVFVYHINDT